MLIPLMRGAFASNTPGIIFDVVQSDLFTVLAEAKIDVNCRTGTSRGQNLVARRLCDLPLVICAAPDYLGRLSFSATARQGMS